MNARRSLAVAALVPWLLSGCATADMAESLQGRLTKAEAEMSLCKQNIGLASAPTPATTALYDSATGPVAQDASQVKIKTLCGRELRELLDARRALNELRRRGTGTGG